MRATPLFASLLLALLAGCQTVPAADAGAPRSPAPVDGATASDNLNAVLWVQRSAEYRAAARTVFQAATARLDAALADPTWDALVPTERARAAPLAGLPPAVIVDIDETMLDNSPYQARMVVDGNEFDDATWEAWVDERRAPAVPGAVEFAQAAAARGVQVVYLSNRTAASREATLANLRQVGLPLSPTPVFLGTGTAVPGCTQSSSSDKTCRRVLVGRSNRVLMQLGDQLGDFAAPSANTPAGREAVVARHGAWLGDRWWMLPNPTYGGWEPALFDNDWQRTRERRRAAKRDALLLSR